MQMQGLVDNKCVRRLALAVAAGGLLALGGCATQQPYYGGGGYGTTYGGGYSQDACSRCGVVQSVSQVYVRGGGGDSNVLGTIVGAVAGGLLGNTVGKGDGRKAATVAGAVVGGAVGHEVAERNDRGGSVPAWRIVVRLDSGQYATVTQKSNPYVDRGDRVQIYNDRVHRL